VNRLTAVLAAGLTKMNFQVQSGLFFDTVTITTDKAKAIADQAEKMEMNFRFHSGNKLSLSLNETTTVEDVEQIWQAFQMGGAVSVNFAALDADLKLTIPAALTRKSEYLTHPSFNSHHSETEFLRYVHMLQNRDLTLAHSMIPLGSCTMKLNATTELVPVSWPEISKLHPFAQKV
jgi:glycine dehydrogenase